MAIYDDYSHNLTTATSQWANYSRCEPASDPHNSRTPPSLMDPNASWDYGFCPTAFAWLPILGMVLYLCSFSAGNVRKLH